MRRVGVVIVNWNSGAGLARCVRSLVRAAQPGAQLQRVVVVDNASNDDSLACCPEQPLLTVLRNPTNVGFARACNQGVQLLEADYLLFLNPDAALSAGSVAQAVGTLEARRSERIGIAGVRLIDESGHSVRTCCRFPSLGDLLSEVSGLDRIFPQKAVGYRMRDFDHLSSREVDHVIGACFLVRSDLFQELGGFDEQFFLYFEDLDFSLRAHKVGWKSWFEAGASAFHQGGGCSARIPGQRLFYSWRSRLLFTRKHVGWFAAALVLAGTLTVEPAVRIVAAALKISLREIAATRTAYGLLLRTLVGRGI